eukprot:gb/GECG01002605.1/.p1 GENE.gb/GECG01002605.1/~~gb/GECG01002605.1/.p1  ORF type:complete len:456 (+),score=80.01 gb/GECG01002605.1/:1-1368(+)
MRHQNRSFEEKQNSFVARRLREKGFDPNAVSPGASKNEVASMLSQQRRRSGSRDSENRSRQGAPDSPGKDSPYAREHFPSQGNSRQQRGEVARSNSPAGSRVSSRELAEMKARAHGDAPHFPSLSNKSQEEKRWQAHQMLGDHAHGYGHERPNNHKNDDNHSVARSTATNKSEYLLTLEQQMKEKEERKRKEKEEQAQWDKKMEEEAERYDYFGAGRRGGGGEPVRDGSGVNVTQLKRTGKDLATYSPSNRSVQSAHSHQARDAHRPSIRRGNQTNDSSGVMAALSFPDVDEGNQNRKNSRSPAQRRIQTSDPHFQGREENLSPRAEIHSVGPPAYEDNNDERRQYASFGFREGAPESKYDNYHEPESKYEDIRQREPRGGGVDSEEVESLQRQLREAKEIVADQHERLNEKDSLNKSLKEENENLHQETERLRERLSTAISILENYRERYGPLE